MTIYYIDTNSLQALINSGTYDAARANAARNGIEFRTTWTVLEDLRRVSPPYATDAERAFLADAQSKIGVDIDKRAFDPFKRYESVSIAEASKLDFGTFLIDCGNKVMNIGKYCMSPPPMEVDGAVLQGV